MIDLLSSNTPTWLVASALLGPLVLLMVIRTVKAVMPPSSDRKDWWHSYWKHRHRMVKARRKHRLKVRAERRMRRAERLQAREARRLRRL
ncbi:hypothetical protein [Actinomadura sp. NBRC 104412]|uniref:hypothetical protein n=1 Tax=Actinomadura sp. NBRC 104412 TaxID=3032203 RepID=UPI002554DECE|nr:hypothetical protein [Actinomadura sp. NBRC 104412]